jgi:uncharacterized protein YsxB (DUF464 family)
MRCYKEVTFHAYSKQQAKSVLCVCVCVRACVCVQWDSSFQEVADLITVFELEKKEHLQILLSVFLDESRLCRNVFAI